MNNRYRWIALAVSCLINLCVGTLYAWSVFANPLAQQISLSSGRELINLSIAFTVTNAVGPLTIISGGYINDRLGSRWVLFIGGILFGAGMILTGMSTSLAAVILSYGIGVGLGNGMIYGCTVSSSVKLFPDKRGLVGGLTTAFYGISSVIIPPIANVLINNYGISSAMRIIGIFSMLVVCIGAFVFSFLFKKATDAPGLSSDQKSAATPKAADLSMNWKQMLATPYFYVMIIMLCAGAVSGLMISSQASPLVQNIFSISPGEAAVIVSVLALFNTGGRLIMGMISDKLGIINTLRIAFILLIAGQILLLISVSSHIAFFIAGVCIVGLCFGAIMGIYPSFTATRFGSAHNSVNYGIMFCGFALAGYIGPLILNSVFKARGTYNLAFIIAAVLAGAGFILTFIKGNNREGA